MGAPSPLLIRADASAALGAGHLMRCWALAEVWQHAGGRVCFLVAECPAALREHLRRAGFALHSVSAPTGSLADAHEVHQCALSEAADWIVVDGYQFAADYQLALKQAVHRVLCVDDYGHAARYAADLILNQNLGAKASLYAGRASNSRLLLGSDYVLLRRQFLPWRERARTIPKFVKNILVTLGGSDPDNVTAFVLEALNRVPRGAWTVTAVVGSANPHRDSLQRWALTSPFPLKLVVQAPDMPELMATADLAVCAGGTTAWELAFMGVPSLVLILAENQAANAQALAEAGIALNLGWHHALTVDLASEQITGLMTDPVQRTQMSARGRRQIDGDGAFRVWLELNEDAVQLRPATASDAQFLWELANDATVRATSFRSDSIPWPDHVRWLTNRLADPQCYLWLALDAADKPIGQVRFDLEAQEAIISVSLCPESRGQNLGPLTIRNACRRLFTVAPAVTIVAFIKTDNLASVRAFTRAGFQPRGSVTVREHLALRYELPREPARAAGL